MSISYTIPADCPIEALRGVTATGGEFSWSNTREQWPDLVRFGEPRPGGKQLILVIKGKPALEAALSDYKAAEARKAERLAALGWPAYKEARERADNARGRYDQARGRGYPAREAAALSQATAALEAARLAHPGAALYAAAQDYSWSDHDAKASAGRAAMRSIEQGADPAQAVAEMESAWAAHCQAAEAHD